MERTFVLDKPGLHLSKGDRMRVLMILLLVACGPSDVASGSRGSGTGSGSAEVGSPFRACVRETMTAAFEEVARKGDEPDAQKIEGLAVFGCQATNQCYGQQECDQKMNAIDVTKRQALEKWK